MDKFQLFPLPPEGQGTTFVNTDFTNTSIPSVSRKLNEVANRMNFSYDSVSNIPKVENFGAITNGVFSQNMAYGLSNMSNQLSFSSLGNINASSLTDALGQSKSSGGVSKFGVMLVSNNSGEKVFFNIMPHISESHSVTYDQVVIAHHPGTIQKYQHTNSRTWGINEIKLASRNAQEASANQIILNTIRGWTQPYYGYGTEKSTASKLGAPPEVLTFTAYGDKNIGPVPVVLESASWDWPTDVDYIHTEEGQPFPVILTITISLLESWSPAQYSQFDLTAYKQGNMVGAYGGSSSSGGSNALDISKSLISSSIGSNSESLLGDIQPQLSGNIPNTSESNSFANFNSNTNFINSEDSINKWNSNNAKPLIIPESELYKPKFIGYE